MAAAAAHEIDAADAAAAAAMEAGRAEGPSPSFSNMRVRCCDLPSMLCMPWVLLRMAGKLKQRYTCGRSKALQAGGGMHRPHWPLTSNLAPAARALLPAALCRCMGCRRRIGTSRR